MITTGPPSDTFEFLVKIRVIEYDYQTPHEEAAEQLLQYLRDSGGHDYVFFEEVTEAHGLVPRTDDPDEDKWVRVSEAAYA